MVKRRKRLGELLLALAPLVACEAPPAEPQPVPGCSVMVSGRQHDARCYRLSMGEFRGALWPSAAKPAFQLLIVTGHRLLGTRTDHVVEVLAPTTSFSEQVTEDWQTVKSTHHGAFTTTELKGATIPGSFVVRTPSSPHRYRYYLLPAVPPGRGVLVFMNPAEGVEQQGVFGYAELDSPGVAPAPSAFTAE